MNNELMELPESACGLFPPYDVRFPFGPVPQARRPSPVPPSHNVRFSRFGFETCTRLIQVQQRQTRHPCPLRRLARQSVNSKTAPPRTDYLHNHAVYSRFELLPFPWIHEPENTPHLLT
ncbi:hypothetical protein E2C01_072257 [Portunus trituberculatus]|uniref:Uncharacterized protein n=1 Tax=Portunus trituberculatus TaxID=210409 RepID=A0A5B7HZE5_PORTR|nr:hypothetical protein [Portunus trituberculatus]